MTPFRFAIILRRRYACFPYDDNHEFWRSHPYTQNATLKAIRLFIHKYDDYFYYRVLACELVSSDASPKRL